MLFKSSSTLILALLHATACSAATDPMAAAFDSLNLPDCVRTVFNDEYRPLSSMCTSKVSQDELAPKLLAACPISTLTALQARKDEISSKVKEACAEIKNADRSSPTNDQNRVSRTSTKDHTQTRDSNGDNGKSTSSTRLRHGQDLTSSTKSHHHRKTTTSTKKKSKTTNTHRATLDNGAADVAAATDLPNANIEGVDTLANAVIMTTMTSTEADGSVVTATTSMSVTSTSKMSKEEGSSKDGSSSSTKKSKSSSAGDATEAASATADTSGLTMSVAAPLPLSTPLVAAPGNNNNHSELTLSSFHRPDTGNATTSTGGAPPVATSATVDISASSSVGTGYTTGNSTGGSISGSDALRVATAAVLGVAAAAAVALL